MSAVEVPKRQNHSSGSPQSKALVPTNRSFISRYAQVKNKMRGPFKHYRIIVSPSHLVKRLRGQRDVRWPSKMIGDLRDRDNTKNCTLHGDYNHLTKDCKHLMWKVNKLAKEGSLKKIITNSGQGSPEGERKRTYSRSGVSEDQFEEEAVDSTVNTIHTILLVEVKQWHPD